MSYCVLLTEYVKNEKHLKYVYNWIYISYVDVVSIKMSTLD